MTSCCVSPIKKPLIRISTCGRFFFVLSHITSLRFFCIWSVLGMFHVHVLIKSHRLFFYPSCRFHSWFMQQDINGGKLSASCAEVSEQKHKERSCTKFLNRNIFCCMPGSTKKKAFPTHINSIVSYVC